MSSSSGDILRNAFVLSSLSSLSRSLSFLRKFLGHRFGCKNEVCVYMYKGRQKGMYMPGDKSSKALLLWQYLSQTLLALAYS